MRRFVRPVVVVEFAYEIRPPGRLELLSSVSMLLVSAAVEQYEVAILQLMLKQSR